MFQEYPHIIDILQYDLQNNFDFILKLIILMHFYIVPKHSIVHHRRFVRNNNENS